MKGKGRKRPPKRSGPAHGRQQELELRKEVRELYDPAAADEADGEEHWEQYREPPRRKQRRPAKGSDPSSPASTPGSPRPAAEASHNRANDLPGTDSQGTGSQGTGSQGTVVSVYSGGCQVEHGGKSVDCVLPSSLAAQQRSALAVGDEVRFAGEEGAAPRIVATLPRRTVLSRPDPQNPRLERVIAANIDIAVLTISLRHPPLRPALVDRYLIAVERSGAKTLLVVNKIDLVPDPEERRRELEPLEPYRPLVLDILLCDARAGEGIEALRRALAGSTAAFVGHSGVGKSSLITALEPQLELTTGAVSGRSGTGRHTTTRSNLFHLRGGIRLIDTPGIREIGLWDLDLDELRAYFPEFAEAAQGCRFANCSHSHEPSCAVRRAVESGGVEPARYATYRRILDSLGEELS